MKILQITCLVKGISDPNEIVVIAEAARRFFEVWLLEEDRVAVFIAASF